VRDSPRGRIPRLTRRGTRRTWRNHTGNQQVEPLQIREPTTLQEVITAVQEAEAAQVTARAVGSHHSWSDVALTRGFVIETHGLNRELPLDCVRSDVDGADMLARTEAGVRLKELNARLERNGRALSNMGGWDAQTVAGVMGTSTHGTGIELGPICDQALSLDVVGSGGTVHRIEPAGGITDPDAFAAEHPDWVLHQDNHWFNSALVGMGCLGIVYAVTLAVRPFYHLTERRYLQKWPQVREQMKSGELLRAHRHVEIYVNVHPGDDGEHLCLVTTRNVAPGPPTGDRRSRRRNWIVELVGRLQPLAPNLIDWFVSKWPKRSPAVLDRALKMLVDEEYTDRWYRVLNLGTANLMPAYSMEIGVEVGSENKHVAAVEAVFEVAARHETVGNVYSTSPISLRFVKASPAYMSMMHGRDTIMLELIQMTRTEGGFELLAEYEEALYALGGRPHWGQYNTLTGSHELMQRMYPRFPDWLAVHAELNASGVFDSPFSKRVGISVSTYAP
jgi:hypothetical protein